MTTVSQDSIATVALHGIVFFLGGRKALVYLVLSMGFGNGTLRYKYYLLYILEK